MTVDRRNIIERGHICVSAVNRDCFGIHNRIEAGGSPLPADDVLSHHAVAVEQAGDLIAIGKAFGAAVSQGNRLISCLDGDIRGNAGYNQRLLLCRIRHSQGTVLYTELRCSLEFFPAEQKFVVCVVDDAGSHFILDGTDIGDAAAGIAEYDPVGKTLLVVDHGHIRTRIHRKRSTVKRLAGAGRLDGDTGNHRDRGRDKGVYGDMTVFGMNIIERRHIHVLNPVVHVDPDRLGIDQGVKIRTAGAGDNVRSLNPVSGQKSFGHITVGIALFPAQISGVEHLVFTLRIHGRRYAADRKVLLIGRLVNRQRTVQDPEAFIGRQFILAEQQLVVHAVNCIGSDDILRRADVRDAAAGVVDDDFEVIALLIGDDRDIRAGSHLQRITVKFLLRAGRLYDGSRRSKRCRGGHHGIDTDVSTL